MQNSNPNLTVSRVPGTWGSLLVLTGLVLIGMAVGNVLALLLLALYTSQGAENVATTITRLITNPAGVPDGWEALMLLQGTVHFFSYLLPALVYWYYIERRSAADFNIKKHPSLHVWLLSFILVLVFIPINSKFIEWNAAMKLPDAWSGLEVWMREKEDQLTRMTAFLTSYKQFSQLLIALFVVVLLPAFGEEVLFRGVIQTKLLRQWRNPHIAIWVSAAIFSAIHFQFYGFLPRMLLGAVFGYLYFWTGNLSIAILAHFVNNGFVLIMMYLHNIGIVEVNIEENESLPGALIGASLVISLIILQTIRKAGGHPGSLHTGHSTDF
ncbi:CPBP family intramembrane glutamic endopeptidase [Dyadobacter sandarakinus]|uniref:CPBP family intramembrane metalloprotease n=1 Tax=Dyadobacter sandarakinus TaxID=2747268 RepID=A0ABX7I8B7_9BACT|nr:CPBP family intramembrane glutamic endopeptidase [Dyadobacter sandarakinus]QRR01978.1 CPBP family intramembrane metalloprotease [Dyadobacter sandarakinus]